MGNCRWLIVASLRTGKRNLVSNSNTQTEIIIIIIIFEQFGGSEERQRKRNAAAKRLNNHRLNWLSSLFE